MNLSAGDEIETKKPHPCGKNSYRFTVMRVGADIKIKCGACGREVMLPRPKVEKMAKKIYKPDKIDKLEKK
jgi:hypothetical protein